MFNPLCSVCIREPTCCSMYPPVVKKFLPSTLVQYLQGMGIAPLMKSLVERKVSLAGRIHYCLMNWECITQNQWILDAVWDISIYSFRCMEC